MPVKLKYGSNKSSSKQASIVDRLHLDNRFVRYALVAMLGCFVVLLGVLGFYYFKYEHIVNDRLAKGPMFASVSQIYAAPREIRDGQKLSVSSIAADLRRAGYNNNPQLGTFQQNGDSLFIKPGPESYHTPDGATIYAPGGIVDKITAENGAALSAYELEPQLITALSEENSRTKRRMVTYKDIPPEMVKAITSIEDRNFFEHSGVNFLRIAKCGVEDLTSGRKRCGGSTITMQLARGFFLSPEKRLKRKFIEILITFQLESRFSKQQIFEMYANQMNLGHRGSYDINGLGEASQAFFGKDLKQLDTAECALLAGMYQSPSRLNPYRHPERAIARRNVVLDSMVETGAISASAATRAKAEPLRLTTADVDASEAPYFVDLVHDQLVQRISDQDLAHQSLRIYTSLDPDLQHAASDAVEIGMKNVDEIIRKRNAKSTAPFTYPQVALVALNPHTGQILALVGGRNYSASQLDHAISKRPTGSIFKPFVYAAAYNSSLNGTSLGESGVFTAATHLNDTPTTFTFDHGRQTYSPNNFKGDFRGDVIAAYALAHSLNNATISLGQQIGFENVAALARSAGIAAARGTPSVSLGAYAATPIDMAGAYTVFANGGVRLKPWMLASVRNTSGDIVSDYSPEAKQVMDPRAAYLTQSLLEATMNYGSAAVVRGRGFSAPGAGKTGTSHDAWFAGYTSNLICIVWVGNDDYTDVKIQGADAAAPIWAEFMKRAIKLPQYSDVKSFSPPDGVSIAKIDSDTGLLADVSCSTHTMNVAFLDGTAPTASCSQMNENPQNFFQKLFGLGGHAAPVSPYAPPTPSPAGTAPPSSPTSAPPAGSPAAPQPAQPEQPKKKKNIFQKIFGGGNDKDNKQPQPAQSPQ
ncbi:transglycosylase domain-containing protein [Edaphobacter modestus]|uniref:peptidoglycan glycosyltransferase n=1 Tax=Edaphobacter modestus TaxID=388466 RepID=A0A4Q7YZS6_9BACT|nr:transglycosylase domain-containing protein [Edaphobacter modestus]RZU43370.1 penicillin-binding protein 1B [Edaphobacter modestus]